MQAGTWSDVFAFLTLFAGIGILSAAFMAAIFWLMSKF